MGVARAGADDAVPHVALLLIEAEDFAALRREHGARAAAGLIASLAQDLASVRPEDRVQVIGRALIEVALSAPTRALVDAAVEQVRGRVWSASISETTPLRTRTGVAMLAGSFVDDPALIEAAEAALEEEKRRAATAQGEAFSGAELSAAVERGELVLHYQPKLHVRRQAIASVEALVRWRHPVHGLIFPNAFIPAAERTGAIEALTLWTLQQVAADQRAMAANGYDLPVFVNIAGALLSKPAFVQAVLALVHESGARFGFEVTETSVISEPERAIDHLKHLAAIGIAIAIDDYGAGLSSLAYLKQLPACELKIDKLFVTQLASSNRDPLIVRSTIDLAHALEMEVVAEGVETPTSLALLSVMGCDLVQGYLISRPLPFDALLNYLREEGHLAATELARSPFGRFAAVKATA